MIDLDELDFDKLSVTRAELEKWMDEYGHLVDEARELWIDLDTQVISAVENPAHDSEFVGLKSEDSKVDRLKYVFKDDSETGNEERIAHAAAMVPDQLDKDGDIIPSPVVRKAAHNYLTEKKTDEVDADHESRLVNESLTDRGTVVESYTLDDPREYETVDGETKEYPVGTWMVKIKFEEETWERIKDGEITGYSIQGRPTVVKYKKGGHDNTNMSETQETEETISVDVTKEDLVSDIATQVSDQIDLEPEVEVKEVVPEEVDAILEALNDEQTETLYETLKDMYDGDSEEQSEHDEDDEEGEEDEESEEKEETEDSESEEAEVKDCGCEGECDCEETEEMDVERQASEKSQTTDDEEDDTATKSEDSDEFEGLWEL